MISIRLRKFNWDAFRFGWEETVLDTTLMLGLARITWSNK